MRQEWQFEEGEYAIILKPPLKKKETTKNVKRDKLGDKIELGGQALFPYKSGLLLKLN